MSFGIKIFSTDSLLGRPFNYGVDDCFTLVKDFYWINYKVNIPNLVRVHSLKPDYSDSLKHYAPKYFNVIEDKSKMIAGDWLLFNIEGAVMNHAAIFIGEGKILHYGVDRLSAISKLSPFYAKSLFKVLRLKGEVI